jgi:hypothetical protein
MRMTKQEWQSLHFRPEIKARLAPSPKRPKKDPVVWVCTFFRTGERGRPSQPDSMKIVAHTKSEARAQLKRLLGLDRLTAATAAEFRREKLCAA